MKNTKTKKNNLIAENKKTLQILETKLMGKVKMPKGETILSLLGRN